MKEKLSSCSSGQWIEYWRNRSATYNTLYQQLKLPEVKNILDILEKASNASESFAFSNFKTQQQIFTKKHSEAKDYVKFLNTLERQFKNLEMGNLQVIEENIPNLLQGLQLIWRISRHISNDQNSDLMRILLICITN